MQEKNASTFEELQSPAIDLLPAIGNLAITLAEDPFTDTTTQQSLPFESAL